MNERLMMGKVEVKIHKMHFTGRKLQRSVGNLTNEFEAATIDTNGDSAASKKKIYVPPKEPNQSRKLVVIPMMKLPWERSLTPVTVSNIFTGRLLRRELSLE